MAEVTVRGQVGPSTLADGAEQAFRQGKTGEQVITELHGRFYEQNYRGAVYSDGMGLTAINNATYTVATTDATITPVVGIWNPSTSSVNVSIIRVTVGLVMTALASTGPGGFSWSVSLGNSAITTGNTPLNRKTLTLGGAQAKGYCNVAPTGKTNANVTRFGSAIGGGSAENTSFTATAVAMQTQALAFNEQFEGDFIVPPGAFVALLANTTPVANSAYSSIVWEEVPL